MSFVEFTGHARLDRRTKHLTKRVGPDDVAIIEHTDLDRVSAEELIESGVRVVVNVAPSQTGRFPNPGPLELVRGGVRGRAGSAEQGISGSLSLAGIIRIGSQGSALSPRRKSPPASTPSDAGTL